MRLYFLLSLLLIFSIQCLSQKSTQAKILYEQAKADTVAKKDSIGAIHFYQSAKEELKAPQADNDFAARTLLSAAQLMFKKVKNLKIAHDYYYEALDVAHKSADKLLVYQVLKQVGALYDASKNTFDVFNFPAADNKETLEAYFSIMLNPDKNKSGKLIIIFSGGSNDGVYEGAEGFVRGLYRKEFKGRDDGTIGKVRVTHVYPNFSAAEVEMVKSESPYYDLYINDMVLMPIRFPKKIKKDVFLEVSFLNIKFVNNSKDLIAHPRTLMYYSSPQLEKDVYASMKNAVLEIYEDFQNDTSFRIPILAGRFKGKTMMDKLKDVDEDNLKAFLGFIRSYPGKYMGGTWKISETYATWLINNSPLGANEAMDSLLSYKKNDKLFNQFAKEHADEIKNNFFSGWQTDAQDFAYSKDFNAAYSWNNVMEKTSIAINNDSLLAKSYFLHGFISSEDNKDDEAVAYYKKSIPLFKKVGDAQGESASINNIGSVLYQSNHYKEAQPYFEQTLQIRLNVLRRDTSNEVKLKVGLAHQNIGFALNKQSKYKEAIEEYLKGLDLIKKIPALNAKIHLASLYNSIGKSYQQMGQYKEAADYYNLEYAVRKALGDEEAMADALDNKAYLLSLIGKNRESLEAYQQAYTLHIKTNNINDAGFSMSNIGQSLWILGKYDSAIVAHTSAIELREKADNKKGQAYSWQKLGGLYKNNGQPQKSLDAYNKAMSIYKTIDDKENYASLLEDFASNYNNVKDYTNALQYYKDALSIYKQIQSKSKIANTIYNIATVYYSDKQYEQSEKTLDSSIAIQTEIKDQSGLLNSFSYKGSIQQVFYGNFSKALTYMKEALQLAVATTSENNIAFTKSRIASLYQGMGMYDSAATYYDLALAGYKKLEDKSNIADVYNNKGYLYSEMVDYPQARKYFEQSLQIAEQSGNKITKANAMTGLSQLEFLTGNFPKAIEVNNNVMQLWKEEDNPWGVADAFLNLGNILNRQSEFTKSITNYQMADSMYKFLRIEKSRATSLNNIGDIYFLQNDYDKALPYFFQALQILQKTNDDKSFISMVKANIGETYIYQRKYIEADKWLGESQIIARSIKNKRQIYINNIVLARLKMINKDYVPAKTFFEEAYSLLKETGDKPSMVLLETEWGKLFYLTNDFNNAEKHLQNSIKLSKEMDFKTYIWKAYSTIGEIREQQKNTTAAVIELEKAIKVVEELKSRLSGGEEAKKTFSNDESVVDLYQRMAKYLKKLGRNDEALAYIEKSNIENIKLRFKNDDVVENSGLKEKKTEIIQFEKQKSEELAKPAEQQNKEKIARLEKMTTIAEADYQQFITNLIKKNPERKDLLQIDAKQFKTEREYIDADVALLSYLISDKELSIFIVMKDTLLIKDIPIDRKMLEQKINQFYKASARPPSKDGRAKRGVDGDDVADENKSLSIDQLSEELYALLIGPAKDAIATKKRVAIVPTGLLCFVPFQSLAAKNAVGKIQYFGDDKQVFYVDKITAVTNGRNRKLNDLKILAVGNADNSLKNAEIEVKNLQLIFPTAMVYLGNEATKEKVLNTQGEYNILHLATHGMLDYTNAENSYLVFAPDKITGDDGKLKINDIDRINLKRFKMVTLSACETAVTQNIVEGWPISTASAFIVAGVPTVIATLWKVDDKATSILMEKFYVNMKIMDKVEALQNAQQFLRQHKEYDDPNYWAPFQLVGLWQ